MEQLTFISGLGPVALRYGLEESIFLHTIVFWARKNKSTGSNYRDGRWWTYNSMQGMTEIFPWWSAKQIRRIANSCKEKGALLIANYNSDGRDRTIWYSPSDELWALYGEDDSGKCILPNGQMHSPKRADACAQMGKPLPCNNHVIYTPHTPHTPQGGACAHKRTHKEPRGAPDWKPDRFEGFWQFYPQKGRKAKQRAMDAWDKLHADDALIDTIAKSLVKLKATEEWQRGIGIPHAATFLNGARWMDADELSFPDVPAEEGSGWAEDPEVL